MLRSSVMGNEQRPRAEDVRAFARRPWSQIARIKAEHRAQLAREHGAESALAMGEALWDHAKGVQPGWPTAEDRARDLAHHREMSRKLRAIAHAFSVR